jgi:plastocyanin
MRGRGIAATLGAFALLCAPAGAHPGHAALITVGNFRFDPPNVTIAQNEYVLWYYNKLDRNHSVTADAGQDMSFDSDAGKQPGQVQHPANDGFSVLFDKTGRYTFHCKVHASMTGSVTVTPGLDPAPPSPPGRPQLTGVKLASSKVCSRRSRRCTKPGVVVRMTLDRKASVRALVRQRSGTTVIDGTLKETAFVGRAGTSSRRIGLGSLRPGQYQLKVVAIDDNTGESSTAARLAFTVRR